MSTVDFSTYDELFKEANRDNLIGKHNFMVVKTTVDAWQDGRTRYKIAGQLTTANNFNIEVTLSQLDTPQEIKDEVQPKVKKGKVMNALNWSVLAKLGKTPETLAQGDEFQIETYRDKPQQGYDTGFVRVRRIVGPAVTSEAGRAGSGNDSDVPF